MQAEAWARLSVWACRAGVKCCSGCVIEGAKGLVVVAQLAPEGRPRAGDSVAVSWVRHACYCGLLAA